MSICETTFQSRSRADRPVSPQLPLATGCQEKPLLCSRPRAQGPAQVLLGIPVPMRLVAHETTVPVRAWAALSNTTQSHVAFPLPAADSSESFLEQKASSVLHCADRRMLNHFSDEGFGF